jgi:hypothetical protein
MTARRRPLRKSAQGSVGRQAQLGRVGIHARTGAGKQAHGRVSTGIHGRAGGSGVAVTASETVMFFVKGFKCSRVQLTC